MAIFNVRTLGETLGSIFADDLTEQFSRESFADILVPRRTFLVCEEEDGISVGLDICGPPA